MKVTNFYVLNVTTELLKEVIDKLETSTYQSAELRLGLTGSSTDEWDRLAKWALNRTLKYHLGTKGLTLS